MTSLSKTWFQHLPKIELHLHLEGSIPYEALWQLVGKYGGDPEVPNIEALHDKFQFIDFPHFIDTWIWKNQFLREYEDFTFIAEAVARDLAGQNIRYVEAFYSPPDFTKRFDLTTQKLTEAIRAGLEKVPDIEIKLIADLVRDFGPESGAITLAEVYEVRDLGVIGIGIGGSEQDFPPEPYEELYHRSRELGFHTSAHAGEVAGAQSVWGAVRNLKTERIGHGTHAIEDPALLDYLAEHQIPIEMCPLSNVCTGSVNAIEEHPVRDFFDRGLLVTVNTDDPKMFNNTLVDEYFALEKTFGFSRSEIQTLILNAIRASWQSEKKKDQMLVDFQNDPGWRF
jgi:adenosine deaminase